MSKKAEERERRKAERIARFDAAKSDFVSKVAPKREPIAVEVPKREKEPRLAPHLERDIATKAREVKIVSSDSRYKTLMTWCTTVSDRLDSWSWMEPRDWTNDEWIGTIKPAFDQFEALTWAELDKQASGSGHKMHHSHEIAEINAEAQARWNELELDQFDTIFRFRLGGTRRAWGYILHSHFYFVWWERNHMIYQVDN